MTRSQIQSFSYEPIDAFPRFFLCGVLRINKAQRVFTKRHPGFLGEHPAQLCKTERAVIATVDLNFSIPFLRIDYFDYSGHGRMKRLIWVDWVNSPLPESIANDRLLSSEISPLTNVKYRASRDRRLCGGSGSFAQVRPPKIRPREFGQKLPYARRSSLRQTTDKLMTEFALRDHGPENAKCYSEADCHEACFVNFPKHNQIINEDGCEKRKQGSRNERALLAA
jgi:hypothetical protein